MKKVISIVVALAMIVAGASSVMANDTQDMQQILVQVKERIPDTSAFEDFSSETNEGINGTCYSFDWNTKDNGDFKNINLTVNENGVITRYHYYDKTIYNRTDTLSINRLSKEDALMKAKALLKELNPDVYPSLMVEADQNPESLYGNTHGFTVKRIENGIPVYGDRGYITLNLAADKIIDFYINYTDGVDFEEAKNILDIKGAWEMFAENVGMELEYQTEFIDDAEKAYLVYLPNLEHDQYIDAKDGLAKNIVRIYNNDRYAYSAAESMKQEAAADAAGSNSALTQKEIKEIEKISGLLSKEEAEKIIRNNNILDFEEGMSRTGISCYKDYSNEDKYNYRLRFTLQNENEYYFASATIDAKSGELLNWTSKTDSNNAEKKYPREELVKRCEEILPIIAPKHFGNSSSNDYFLNDENTNSENLYYTRYINGVKFNKDTVSIGLNAENGKVNSYRIGYTDIEFPSVDEIIENDTAIKKLSEQAKLTLYYIPTMIDVKNKKSDAVLGYVLDNLYDCRIDANTGLLKKYKTEENKIPEYTDISGHYAENAIKTLAKYGIGFESGELKPNSKITQQEYAALLVSTFVNNSPIILKNGAKLDNFYTQAVTNNIIRESDGNPGDTLKREKAAVYMIRAMKAEKYAELDIYKPMFTDISSNVGYISILSGMNVFRGDEKGNFNPEKELTRAEAIMTIYNYLAR